VGSTTVVWEYAKHIQTSGWVRDITWPALGVEHALGARVHQRILSHANVHGAHVLIHTDQREYKHHEDNSNQKHHDGWQRRSQRKQDNLYPGRDAVSQGQSHKYILQDMSHAIHSAMVNYTMLITL
jgi:hypothetical protein